MRNEQKPDGFPPKGRSPKQHPEDPCPFDEEQTGPACYIGEGGRKPTSTPRSAWSPMNYYSTSQGKRGSIFGMSVLWVGRVSGRLTSDSWRPTSNPGARNLTPIFAACGRGGSWRVLGVTNSQGYRCFPVAMGALVLAGARKYSGNSRASVWRSLWLRYDSSLFEKNGTRFLCLSYSS